MRETMINALNDTIKRIELISDERIRQLQVHSEKDYPPIVVEAILNEIQSSESHKTLLIAELTRQKRLYDIGGDVIAGYNATALTQIAAPDGN